MPEKDRSDARSRYWMPSVFHLQRVLGGITGCGTLCNTDDEKRKGAGMTKNERALKAAETIRKYCQSISIDCAGCIFDKHESTGILWKGCMLNNPDHLPETWELEKIGKNTR